MVTSIFAPCKSAVSFVVVEEVLVAEGAGVVARAGAEDDGSAIQHISNSAGTGVGEGDGVGDPVGVEVFDSMAASIFTDGGVMFSVTAGLGVGVGAAPVVVAVGDEIAAAPLCPSGKVGLGDGEDVASAPFASGAGISAGGVKSNVTAQRHRPPSAPVNARINRSMESSTQRGESRLMSARRAIR